MKPLMDSTEAVMEPEEGMLELLDVIFALHCICFVFICVNFQEKQSVWSLTLMLRDPRSQMP